MLLHIFEYLPYEKELFQFFEQKQIRNSGSENLMYKEKFLNCLRLNK